MKLTFFKVFLCAVTLGISIKIAYQIVFQPLQQFGITFPLTNLFDVVCLVGIASIFLFDTLKELLNVAKKEA